MDTGEKQQKNLTTTLNKFYNSKYLSMSHNFWYFFWGAYLKQQNHTLSERFKIVNIIDATLFLDVHEEGHTEYGKDKHD